MQVVCEATQCNNVPVQVAALQNLVKIMSLYYQYMEAYMGPALFAVSMCILLHLQCFVQGVGKLQICPPSLSHKDGFSATDLCMLLPIVIL